MFRFRLKSWYTCKSEKSFNSHCDYFQAFYSYFTKSKSKIFHYTRCITPKCVTSLLRGPSPRHCARTTQLLSKKCCNRGEPLATQYSIWPARDLNLIPPAPETNALPLDQQAGSYFTKIKNYKQSNKNILLHTIISQMRYFAVRFFKKWNQNLLKSNKIWTPPRQPVKAPVEGIILCHLVGMGISE